MYWCKQGVAKKSNITSGAGIAYAVFLAAVSCTAPNDVQEVVDSVKPYFSLEDYFKQEASRLQQHSPTIAKTVSKDGETESHDIQIADWEIELALFIDSDINKADWQDSYSIDSTETALVYTSLDPKLRTEQIMVERYGNGMVKHIGITNQIKNMLYQTTDQLDYYPDSLYRITKQQRVRVIGESNYVITGIIQ